MVVLLVGLLTAVAVPRFSEHLDVRSVDAAARLLQADIDWARARAVSTSQSITIEFAASGNSYRLSRTPPHRQASSGLVTLTDDPWNSQISSLQRDVGGAALNAATLTVNGAGVIDEDLIVTLVCRNAKRTVVIDAAAGRVTVN